MPRERIALATMLMTRIKTSKTSPAAKPDDANLQTVKWRTYRWPPQESVGWFQPGLQKRLPKAVKSSGRFHLPRARMLTEPR